MTAGLALTTAVGGFLFPFAIRMMWGKMVESWGPAGGWMAAAFIVGTLWTINHGLGQPLIYQSGAWVDMAWGAGIGLIAATMVLGGSLSKAFGNILAAITGGVLGGFLLSVIMKVMEGQLDMHFWLPALLQ